MKASGDPVIGRSLRAAFRAGQYALKAFSIFQPRNPSRRQIIAVKHS
jgi:hypothetical protein